MPFVPRALYDEMCALLRDQREGRLVRLEARVGAGAAAADQTPERRGPSAPSAAALSAALPADVLQVCEEYSFGDREEFTANAARARKLLAAHRPVRDVVAAIRQGANLDATFI